MEKAKKAPETKTEEAEVTIDSAGQANPAVDLERKNIQEAQERQEEKDKEAAKKG